MTDIKREYCGYPDVDGLLNTLRKDLGVDVKKVK